MDYPRYPEERGDNYHGTWDIAAKTYNDVRLIRKDYKERPDQIYLKFDKKHYDIVKIPIEQAGKNFIKDSTYLKIISDKSVEGTVNMELSGDEAWYLSAKYHTPEQNQESRFGISWES